MKDTHTQNTPQKLAHTTVYTSNLDIWGEVEEGAVWLNGDKRRRLGVMNTQYSMQMMFYRTVYLKPM